MKRFPAMLAVLMLAISAACFQVPALAADPNPLRVEERARTKEADAARERLKAAEKTGDEKKIKAARKEYKEAKKKRDAARAKLKESGK